MVVVFEFDLIQSFMQLLGYERNYGKSYMIDPDIHRDPIFTVRNAEKVLSFMDAESTKYRKDVIEKARKECEKNNVIINDKIYDVSIITNPMMIHFICVGTVHMIESGQYYEQLRFNVFNDPQQDQFNKKIQKSFKIFSDFCRQQGSSILLMKIKKDKANCEKNNEVYVENNNKELARKCEEAILEVEEQFGIYLQEKCLNIRFVNYLALSEDPPAIDHVDMNLDLFYDLIDDPLNFQLVDSVSVLKIVDEFMVYYKQEMKKKIIELNHACSAK